MYNTYFAVLFPLGGQDEEVVGWTAIMVVLWTVVVVTLDTSLIE